MPWYKPHGAHAWGEDTFVSTLCHCIEMTQRMCFPSSLRSEVPRFCKKIFFVFKMSVSNLLVTCTRSSIVLLIFQPKVCELGELLFENILQVFLYKHFNILLAHLKVLFVNPLSLFFFMTTLSHLGSLTSIDGINWYAIFQGSLIVFQSYFLFFLGSARKHALHLLVIPPWCLEKSSLLSSLFCLSRLVIF